VRPSAPRRILQRRAVPALAFAAILASGADLRADARAGEGAPGPEDAIQEPPPEGAPEHDLPPPEDGPRPAPRPPRDRPRLDPDEPPPSDERRGGERLEDGEDPYAVALDERTFRLHLFFVPALQIWNAEEDKHWIEEVRDGPALDGDFSTGEGFGLRVGIGDVKRFWAYSVGVLYMGARHRERNRRAPLETHIMVAELESEWFAPSRGTVQLFGGGAAGLGGFVYDFDRVFHDTGGLALEARAFAGVRFLDRFETRVSAGGVLLGYPSELLGTGAFLTVEVGLWF
jgi:hypothetical protein